MQNNVFFRFKKYFQNVVIFLHLFLNCFTQLQIINLKVHVTTSRYFKAADLQNILENHKLQIFQNISSNIYNSC